MRTGATRQELTQGTIAHLSDLHIGRSAANDGAARSLVAALVAEDVDKVLVSGDVTHRGRLEELADFRRIFAPVQERLAVVPGNHDRLGQDAAAWLMSGRVQLDASPGLFVVRLDSTAPHNRSLVDGHGRLTPRDIAEVESALARAPMGALVVLMLHHHLHPLPGDDLFDRVSAWAGWPFADELRLGGSLLHRLTGHCDLVLHGHRHRPGELVLAADGSRPLRVLNAGASPAQGGARVFTHAAGRIVSERWLTAAGTPAPIRSAPGLPAAA
jgi:3',5'-cyclic AMP phosphodiesterase CpdA